MFLLILSFVFARRKQAVTFYDYPHSSYYNCGPCTYTRRCQDKTKCADVKFCSDWEAAQRAGFLCDGFPHYQGGYPLANLIYDSEREVYNCLTDNQRRLNYELVHNTTEFALLNYFDEMGKVEEKTPSYRLSKSSKEFEAKLHSMRQSAGFQERRRTTLEYCDSWETYEYSEAEQEFGQCACDKEDESGNFCALWSCHQEEIERCEASGCSTIDRYTCRCYCDSDDYCDYRIWNPLVEYEYSDCRCLQASENRTFCESWYCEEWDDDGFFNIEYEYYNCTVNNGKYCTNWFGDIDGAEEFEKSECYCRINGDNFCKEWICNEKGLHYVYPNYAWVLLPFFLSSGCFVCSFAIEINELICCAIFTGGCLALLLVAYLSGVWGMIILTIMWTAFPALVFLISAGGNACACMASSCRKAKKSCRDKMRSRKAKSRSWRTKKGPDEQLSQPGYGEASPPANSEVYAL